MHQTQTTSLPRWAWSAFATRFAVLAMALALAGVAGALVAVGNWQIAVAMAVALPGLVIVARSPFAGLLVWLLVVPYFLQQPTAETSPMLWVLHRLAIPALLLLSAAYHVLGIRRSQFRLRWYDVALVAFLAVGAVNILALALNPSRMFAAFYDQLAIPIAFFWLVRAIGPSRSDLNRLIIVGAWTVVVQATIGAISWIAPSALPAQWLGRAGERTVGTFGGPAAFTITLVLFALLALYATLSDDRWGNRLALGVVVLAALVGVFLSLSRGSWLGASLAFGASSLVYRRQLARFAIAAGLLALLLAVSPVGGLLGVAEDRLAVSDTIEGRIVTNDASLRIVRDHPLAGVGYGNFERFDEQYKQRVGDIPLVLGGSSHNTYLNMLAELGIPAVVLYLIVPVSLAVLTYRLWLRHRHSRAVDWRLVAILWLALLDQFVVNNFLEIIHSSPWATSLWWITLGLIAYTVERARFAEHATPNGRR